MKNKKECKERYEQRLDEALGIVFEKSDTIEFETDPEGIVTLLIRQDHPVQRFLRRLHAEIPQYRRIKLDALGSFVFLHIDGSMNVEGLGNAVEDEFGEKAYPVYQRLLMFLEYMDMQCHYIKRIL